MDEEDHKLDEFLNLLKTATVETEEEEVVPETDDFDDFTEECLNSLQLTSQVNWATINTTTTASNISFSGATFSTSGAFTTSHAEYLRGEEIDGQFVIEVKSELPVVIKTQNGEINLDKLAAMMTRLDEALCVVEKMNAEDPNFPALQTAYRHFRVVEAISRSTPPPEDGE